jgi:hypothetical protein
MKPSDSYLSLHAYLLFISDSANRFDAFRLKLEAYVACFYLALWCG